MITNLEITTKNKYGGIEDIKGYGPRGEVLYHDLCAKGKKYTHTYNEEGYVTRTEISDGRTTTYYYREGTNYISKRILFDPHHLPNHIITEYERGNTNTVYQYTDDELVYVREYTEDNLYNIISKYDSTGTLESVKYKHKGSNLIRRILDCKRGKDLKYKYDEYDRLTKVTNYRDVITRYIYNEDGTIDYILEYKYDRNGKFLKAVTHQHNYMDGRLVSITINGDIVSTYEYKQL